MYTRASLILLLVMIFAMGGCGPSEPENPPNFVWVVWDTVRADRLSIYGHDKPTTPFLEEWAGEARVFDNCLSVAATTAPSHASMFTGLMPGEHHVDNTNSRLPDPLKTIAELLKKEGYQNYIYSANPFISKAGNFTQGFDRAEHPWSKPFQESALRMIQQKLSQSGRDPMTENIHNLDQSPWRFTSTGELAQQGAEAWLASRDSSRPFFIFLNYMEAHTPRLPSMADRQSMMNTEQVKRSYEIRDTGLTVWSYVFGLTDLAREDLDILAATYDASLRGLDDLFRNLMVSLEAQGYLDNTVVILTSDHGEHLGEHHLLNHQYSLYNQLLKMPLVIDYPERFIAGRDPRPVMNIDLFRTILELADMELPEGFKTRTVSLLSPQEERIRLAEYSTPGMDKIHAVKKTYKNWDPLPFHRSLRALFIDRYKFIWSSDGRHELYEIDADPGEQEDLSRSRPDLVTRMAGDMQRFVAGLQAVDVESQTLMHRDEAHQRRLEALGYLY